MTEVGIVGLPATGKTLLFQALTGSAKGGTRGSGPAAAQVGVAKVPDPRLEQIARFIETREIVPATIQVVDIPGFAAGGEAAAFARQVLAHIRQVDALCHVVRCFTRPGGSPPTPETEIDEMVTEMILADLAVAEPAREKAQRASRGRDPDAAQRLEALEKVIPVLEDGRTIRSIARDLTEADEAALLGFGMLTAKPVLYVANIGERDVGGEMPASKDVHRFAEEHGGEAITLCVQLEAELAELEPEDRAEMLGSLGLDEPALNRTARALYHLLGLTSFYTAGEKQIRAWPIPIGATAPDAAGAVHTDIQRGFIRAECYHVDQLVEHGSEKALREAGLMRSEGKNYVLRDGDVVHFLFNV